MIGQTLRRFVKVSIVQKVGKPNASDKADAKLTIRR